MKITIISDLHLNNRFSEKKYNILKDIISKCDQLIINGDFWDGYIVSFDSFINSEWKKLFPLLLEKQTVYIFGNHDREIDCDDRVASFSKQALNAYKFQNGEKNFIAIHGQEYHPTTLDKYKFLRKHRLLVKFLNIPHQIKENVNAKFLNYKFYKKDSQVMKSNFLNSKRELNTIYIMGHSHFPEIDLGNSYVNTGMIDFGMVSWVEIEDGEVSMKREEGLCK